MSEEITETKVDENMVSKSSNFKLMVFLFFTIGLFATAFYHWLAPVVANEKQLSDAIHLATVKIAEQKSEQTNLLDATKSELNTQLGSQKARIHDLSSALLENKHTLMQILKKSDNNKDDWLLFSIAERLRVVNLSLVFTHDRKAVLDALTQIDSQLKDMHDAGLLSLRNSLTRDISALKATPDVDLEGILTQLGANQSQLKNLPLKYEEETMTPPQAASLAKHSDGTWRARFSDALKHIEKIVVVRHYGKAIEPMPTPKEEAYLRHNLYFLLQQAQWAAISGNTKVYKMSLRQAREWIELYFDPHSEVTRAELAALAKLQALPVKVTLPRLNNTIKIADELIEHRLRQ